MNPFSIRVNFRHRKILVSSLEQVTDICEALSDRYDVEETEVVIKEMVDMLWPCQLLMVTSQHELDVLCMALSHSRFFDFTWTSQTEEAGWHKTANQIEAKIKEVSGCDVTLKRWW